MGSPEHFAVHARFQDWSAFEGHAETPHLKRAMPRINALLASPLALEIYLEVI
jgi:quinol monooxygenase YgiN